MRALKRQLSDVSYRRLHADAKRLTVIPATYLLLEGGS